MDKTLPSNGGGAGLIPGGGTKVPRAMGCSQNLKNKTNSPVLPHLPGSFHMIVHLFMDLLITFLALNKMLVPLLVL